MRDNSNTDNRKYCIRLLIMIIITLIIVFLVLKETLDNRGVLGQIKARIRAEVFSALDDQMDGRPPLSNENMLINELILEYLEFNKYKYTASVLGAGNLYTLT